MTPNVVHYIKLKLLNTLYMGVEILRFYRRLKYLKKYQNCYVVKYGQKMAVVFLPYSIFNGLLLSESLVALFVLRLHIKKNSIFGGHHFDMVIFSQKTFPMQYPCLLLFAERSFRIFSPSPCIVQNTEKPVRIRKKSVEIPKNRYGYGENRHRQGKSWSKYG